MESSVKKKKRRTRKCLDEIRKRSRMMRVNGFGETSHRREKINKTEESHTYNQRLITMNRLTLNIFPKAIRSETITRPLLEEIKQKSSYNFRVLDENVIGNSSLRKDREVECFEGCDKSPCPPESMPVFDMVEQSQNQEHGSGSPVIIPFREDLNSHSPTRVNISETPADAIAEMYSTSTTTSLSSQTLDGDHELELYEELMNKVSSHLKKVTSALIKEDVIKNTKIKLQKLYIRSWSNEYQTSMLEQEKSRKAKTTFQSPKDAIVQNPLDYIRLKHVQQKGACDADECHSCLSQSFSSQAATDSHSSLDYTRDIALYRTPEYNYFPHRLNE